MRLSTAANASNAAPIAGSRLAYFPEVRAVLGVVSFGATYVAESEPSVGFLCDPDLEARFSKHLGAVPFESQKVTIDLQKRRRLIVGTGILGMNQANETTHY